MNKHRILISALVFLLSYSIYAQVEPIKIYFTAFSGIATYKMDQLKQLNELVAENLTFDIKKINSFDPGFYLGGLLQTHILSKIEICLRYQYNTTGSRIGQKDYSGCYTFDQIVNGHLLGIEPEIIMDEKEHYRVSFSIMSGALFTTVKTEESIEISGDKKQDSEYMSAFSVPVCLSIKLSVPIIKNWISGSFFPGYLFDTGGKVHLKGNRDAILKVDDEYVKTEWSGLRIAIGLKFNLD